MRILIHFARPLAGANEADKRTLEQAIAHQLVQQLRQRLQSQATLVDSRQPLRDAHPDLIHIIGVGDHATAALMSRAEKLSIPYVITPMGTLQPWLNHRWPAFSPDSTIMASSQIELENLSQHASCKHLQYVGNPIVTTALTPDEYATQMMELYTQAISRHDQLMRQQIALRISQLEETDETICDILRQVLYVEYQHHRNSISQTTLHQLATTLTTADYDEAQMAQQLDALQLTNFFAQLETLLAEASTLTEGFMPIEARPNKQLSIANP